MTPRSNSGFTLIELITVIVILGVLAAVAVPRFIDLQTEAAEAATEGVAGNLSSASSINLAAGLADSNDATSVAGCRAVGDLLEGGLPADYSIRNDVDFSGNAEGESTVCTVAYTPEDIVREFQAFRVDQ